MSAMTLIQGLTEMAAEPRENDWLEQILPSEPTSPVERVRQLAAASQLIRDLQAEIEVRLEAERQRTQSALDQLQRPESPQLQRAYEFAAEGLNQHFEALDLLAAEDYEAARDLAERADECLEEAEYQASQVDAGLPPEG